jgi:hypothetical protein
MIGNSAAVLVDGLNRLGGCEDDLFENTIDQFWWYQ